MPTYSYRCSKCKKATEEFRSIKDGPRKKCPKCGSTEPIFYQDYSACNVQFIDYMEPKTVGQQAAKNQKRLGKERMQLKEESQKGRRRKARKLKLPKGAQPVKASGERPWWRDSDEIINPDKIDVPTYIYEGKKVPPKRKAKEDV